MTKHTIGIFFAAAGALAAEVHTLELGQAVERALAQNPEVIIARLDQQKAEQQIRVARDPFYPKVFAGSGLAYTYGFPMSIEGSAPSIFQAEAAAALVNRPLSHRVAQAREEAKGAEIGARTKQEEIALRTVELYLEAETAARRVEMARGQIETFEKVAAAVRLRVEEGREMPIEARRAELDIAVARQRLKEFEADLELAESDLASVAGYEAGDRVRAAAEERAAPAMPASEEAAIADALDDHPSLLRLESALAAKGYELKAERSEWLPRLSLVAKYGLFSRFNNYEEYFQRFQRHNGLAGISVEVPLYVGPGVKARAAQAQTDTERLRAEMSSTRSQIALEARRSWQELDKARTGSEVARLDLDLARESLGIVLARMDEGHASLQEVEAARYAESEKWIAYYEARHRLEVARYALLDQTGGLLAALGH